jgi:hypothetical protein
MSLFRGRKSQRGPPQPKELNHKERKERRDKDLWCFFFAIFAFLAVKSSFGCGWPRWAIRGKNLRETERL